MPEGAGSQYKGEYAISNRGYGNAPGPNRGCGCFGGILVGFIGALCMAGGINLSSDGWAILGIPLLLLGLWLCLIGWSMTR